RAHHGVSRFAHANIRERISTVKPKPCAARNANRSLSAVDAHRVTRTRCIAGLRLCMPLQASQRETRHELHFSAASPPIAGEKNMAAELKVSEDSYLNWPVLEQELRTALRPRLDSEAVARVMFRAQVAYCALRLPALINSFDLREDASRVLRYEIWSRDFQA